MGSGHPVAEEARPEPPKLRLPAVAEPTAYAVELTIVPSEDSFRGLIDIEVRVKEKTSFVWLNGTDLKIERASASVGGRMVGARAVAGGEDFVGLAFERPLGPGEMKLRLAYTGTLSKTSTTGLFKQKDGEDWYVFSQFEATDARRAFPCFDEPSYKVPWRLTVRIPKGASAVSNTPILSESGDSDGMKVVRFRRTPPLPSYLVALGVGPFDYVGAGRAGMKKTPIRIIVPRGKSPQARYAAQVTGPLLERLERYFGTPFPYEKLDQLAIPQTVTFGAMENAGLITWAEPILLASPPEETISFQRRFAAYNAHEMAHQWFGDLVTLAWWDDIWLNESFASWMQQKIIMGWKPEWREDVARVVSRSNVMGEDTLVTARKIRQEIATKDDIVNAFDGITYQKGAAVLDMFEAWVGEPKFQAGVRKYLEAHRFGSATARDFLQALEAASRPGVAAAFSTFLDQAGVPLLEVSLDCGGGNNPQLRFSQRRFLPVGSTGSTAQTWQVPVCVRAGEAGKPERTCALLAGSSGTMALRPASCPSWLLANDGELGYYRTLYREDLLGSLLSVVKQELSQPELVGVIRDVGALAEGGALPMGQALELVPRFAPDPSRQTVSATIRIATDIKDDHLVPPDLRRNYARFISKMYDERARALGFVPKPGEDDDTRLLRKSLVPFVASDGEDPELQAEAKSLTLKWLEDPGAVDADLVDGVLGVAAANGNRALFDRFHEGAKQSKERRDRRHFLGAIGSFRDEAIEKDALAIFLSDEFDAREATVLLFAGLKREWNRQRVWDFLKANYDGIVARLPREATGILPFFGAYFCDEAHRKDVETSFQGRVEKLPGGPRHLAESLEAISLCTALKDVHQPSVRAFLEKY
jgi:alanyl aminopeptidase